MSGFISSFLKKRHSPAVRIEEEASLMNFGLARVIKYEELKKATNNFNTVLGNGGYGRVYLGKLQEGQMVAVKVLLDHNPKRLEQFFNEVTALSRLRHKNLVSLYGCTSPRSQELLLVYEYVPNGTVADHLHGKRTTLTLAMRVQIAMETAEALAYLHSLEPPLIHRDVKTSNILLDYEFHVKVADLGICRLLPWDSTHVSTVPQGTMGYRDPEYERYFRLTDKTDVYSFGVVLMELISGQQAVDVNRAPEDVYLNIMALDKILNKKLDTFVDPELGYHSNNGVRRIIDSVAELASNCLQPEGDMRPSMLLVLTVLKGIQNEKHQMPHQDGRQEEVHVKGIQHEKQQKDTNSFDPQQELHDDSLNEVYRDAKLVLEKDTSQRQNNSQCKDEKERDGELHPEKSKAARNLSNDSSDEVLGKKQSIGDVEKSACNSSKLHSYADRNRSENQHSKKVDSAVGDNLSKSSPNPIITRSRSKHCLGCRSREEAQREQLSHEKSRVSAASTKDHGSTSEIRKRNSVYQHSKKFQYSVGENRSKNSPSSQAIKHPSRCIREKTYHSWGFLHVLRCKSNEGGSTRKESLSQGNLHVSASSRVDHSGASRAWKRDSKHGYSEEADTTTSHILQDRSWCRLRQGNSTQRESLSHEKSRPSVASTAGHCSTPRVSNREPQYQHPEKADFNVCNYRSKNSSSSLVKYQSRLKQGNSTQREPSSREKFCANVASTVDNCSTPGVGKRDPQNQHLEKVDFSVCDNQSKKSSISFVNQYQRGSRSKEGNSTSSSQAVDLKNCRAWGSEARISPIKLIEVKTHVCEEDTH